MHIEIKAYLTKYALTHGIIEVNGVVDTDYGHLEYTTLPSGKQQALAFEWRYTKEDAIAMAEEMRKKEIESLKNKIARLEKLTFEVD